MTGSVGTWKLIDARALDEADQRIEATQWTNFDLRNYPPAVKLANADAIGSKPTVGLISASGQ